MNTKVALASLCALALSACVYPTYITEVKGVSGLSASTPTGKKIAGEWFLVLEDELSGAKKSNFNPQSQACGVVTLSIDASKALRGAVESAFSDVFENLAVTRTPGGGANVIRVRIDDFSAKASCILAAGVPCSATVEISLLASVQKSGQRRNFSASGTRSADGQGQACAVLPTILEDASRKAIREVVERVADRIVLTAAQ